MFEVEVKTRVRNLKEAHARYIVARLVNGVFWFWGAWDDKDKADDVAGEFENGVVFDTQLTQNTDEDSATDCEVI